MTLESEVGKLPRAGQYWLGIRETKSFAARDGGFEFEWVGSLEDIEQFAHDLSMQIRDLKPPA